MHRFLLLLLIFLFSKSIAQDFSTLKDKKPFDYGGSFSFNQNSSYRQIGEYVPYSLFLSGNANLSIYGIALPFSFSYSNQQINYSQPFNFNQFGAQPSYKWAKAYVGYNSMSFSSYSLNGHQFLGGGIELAPPDLGVKFSAMYGRLVKGVEWDSTKIGQNPYYKRLGFATKFGYNKDGANYEIGVFRAWDILNSIPEFPDSLGLQPKDNMVYTINLSKTLFQKVKVSAEVAANSLTNDTRQENAESIEKGSAFFLSKRNGTTTFSKAMKGSVNYLGSIYSIGLAYERVDPNYSTLGAYYINNDFENIAVTFTNQLLKGKVNIAGNIGMQRNNLDRKKVSSSRNLLNSINISFVPNEKMNFSTSYTNQAFYTFIRNPFESVNNISPYQNLDTLNFTQISQSAMLNGNFILGSVSDKEMSRSLNFNLSYQQSNNRQAGNSTLDNSSNYQGSVMYTHSFNPINLLVNGTIISNYNIISKTDNFLMIGPVIGVSKSFLNKKITSNCSVSYNLSYRNKNFTGEVLSFRVGGGFSHLKVHRVTLNLSFIYRNNPIELANKRTIDFNGTLSYTYTLSKD
ncbi:MAG: hypothetical protein WBJ36_02345 [Tenuifilum sp.]|uniref:hypothetical protein n=1 Tax=Tenuifilum sp. TaxID=2760880 RepID=UPI001B5991BC|nr:hypothetical protein [Bacteroidales bacterium]MBP9029218.1 hypothetical protein [Bacteroidales bacterium]